MSDLVTANNQESTPYPPVNIDSHLKKIYTYYKLVGKVMDG